MTLLVGARCSDGVVLAADQKVVRGGETDYRTKLHEVGGVVLALEGLSGLGSDFIYALETEVGGLPNGFDNLLDAKLIMEDLVKGFYERYVDRIGDAAYFGAMIAGLREIHSGPAQLYYIHPQGYGEAVDYRCSGHGAPYAHSTARYLINPDAPANLNAYRAAFVVSWVAEDVDNTVGGLPEVAILKDGTPDIEYLAEDAAEVVFHHAERIQENLPNLFVPGEERAP